MRERDKTQDKQQREKEGEKKKNGFIKRVIM